MSLSPLLQSNLHRTRHKWEFKVRVLRSLEEKIITKMRFFSCIYVFKNQIYFASNHLQSLVGIVLRLSAMFAGRRAVAVDE